MNFTIPSGLSPNDFRELLNIQLVGLASFGGVTNGVYYVDATNGDDDAYSGSDWNHAFASMEKALDTVEAGDFIFFKGTISEHDLTLDTNDVTIVGAMPSVGSNVWQQASAADKSLLTITATGCRIFNIKFRPMGYAGTSARGITLSGAHYTQIIGCRFQGRSASRAAIYVTSADNCVIANNTFIYNNTATYGAAIVDGAAAGTDSSGWTLANNVFHANVIHVAVQLRESVICGNVFSDYGLGPAGSDIQTTVKLDISGGVSGNNRVFLNHMFGDYSTANASYVSGTHDSWYNNPAEDTAETEVTALEVTTAVPAS